MADVDLLLLDLNGVLYDYDPDERTARLASSLGVEQGAVQAALFDSGLEDASDAGDISPTTYLREVSRHLGVELDQRRWADGLAGAVTARRPVLDLVRSVTGQVRCATLSNNGLLVRDLIDEVYPEVAALGLEVHVAAEFGESKPDRDVYLDTCEALDVSPTRTAFTDDRAANARGAAAAGLRAHHYEGLAGFAAFLEGLGLEPGPVSSR